MIKEAGVVLRRRRALKIRFQVHFDSILELFLVFEDEVCDDTKNTVSFGLNNNFPSVNDNSFIV